MNKRFVITSLLGLLSFFGFGQASKSITTPEIEKEIDAQLNSMSLSEKVGQTCQITLDVLLKTDTAGKVIEPIAIDPQKVKEALLNYHVGSVLNVGWHTLSLAEWSEVMKYVHEPYLKKQTKTPIIYGIDAIHGVNYTIGGTLFPQEIGLAATWNPLLAEQFGEIVAYESRASGIHWNFSPVLDLARQPLWSRTFETLGEDPYLASEMGQNIIKGYQGGTKIDSYHVASCMKHFVGYGNPMSGRDRTPGWIPEKYMRELYLPAFEAATKEGALTVMINSGVVNGVPGHANHHLITEVLKGEWNFEGFAVSDWEDYLMLNTVHRTAETTKAGIVQAINAGVDMSMVPYAPYYQEYCKLTTEAVNEGSISMERLNDAVRRILRVKILLGLYEKNMNQAKKYPEFASAQHQQSALNAALESITLLKNEGEILPLKKNQKVLVSGPTANNLIYLNGAWTHTWQGDNPNFNTVGRTSILEEFQKVLGKDNVLYSEGAKLLIENGYEATQLVGVEDFKSKAASSDVIVLCLGEFPATEKPGDIRSLNLLPEQQELAKAAYATGKPVVLVLTEGRPRIIRDIVKDASAIVETYLPGDFGAEALLDLLYGEVNFSGKLPYTYQKYDGQVEFYDHPRSVDRHKNGFDGYDPQWDFGFGLSYTTFEYSNLTLSKKSMNQSDTITVSVDITNKGKVVGKEVVQLFISDEFASLIPTGKSLKGFQKIQLAAGETKTVRFQMTLKDLKFADANGEWIFEPGTFSVKINKLISNFELN
ncbi:glycoside hydrolase family 3 N-terminal domain-containing protein [Fluviicola sp.]|uniref:glycoside hydrolase family 3 N-terminal domain-containing protein n=1 Tax=Fluviicola sp. TaxID=1917219 RepID=UPI003D299AB7